MADQYFTQQQLSTFCGSIAMMLRAGISLSETSGLFSGNAADAALEKAAASMGNAMEQGSSFSDAAEATGVFPAYALGVFRVGEMSGRLDQTLERLSNYYDRQSRLHQRLRSSLVYPVVLLLMMCGVLAVLVFAVLPMFERVYTSLTGSLAASAYAYVLAASVIGRVSMVLAVAVSVILLALAWMARRATGRQRMQGWLERAPGTRKAAWTLAVAQMTSSLATLLSSGIDEDAAMGLCLEQIGHEKLKSELGQCREEMQQGKGLADTLMRHSVLPGLYGRMLVSAAETGNLSSAMERIAQQMEEDAEAQLSDLIDRIEPILIGFLTVSVGLTLLSVMLPLLGILSAI